MPDSPTILIAHADCSIKKWDFGGNQLAAVGQHSQPVKDVYAFQAMNQTVIVSGGWDSRVKFWQWASPSQLKQIGEAYTAKPVHYLAGNYPLLVTAHSELVLHYWNLDNIF